MNKQTEQFLKAFKHIEENKIVELNKARNEELPSKELQKIFRDIEQMDAEREAWQKMFNLQSRLVVGLEMDKIRLEKEIKKLKEENKTLLTYLENRSS